MNKKYPLLEFYFHFENDFSVFWEGKKHIRKQYHSDKINFRNGKNRMNFEMSFPFNKYVFRTFNMPGSLLCFEDIEVKRGKRVKKEKEKEKTYFHSVYYIEGKNNNKQK